MFSLVFWEEGQHSPYYTILAGVETSVSLNFSFVFSISLSLLC